jgi:hypothetical protein
MAVPSGKLSGGSRRRRSTRRRSGGGLAKISGGTQAQATQAQQRAAILQQFMEEQRQSDEGFDLGDVTNAMGNFLGGAKDAAVGFLPAMWEAVQNPITAGEQMVDDYRTRYGGIWDVSLADLVTDNDDARTKYRTFAGEFEDNPFSYVVDVASIATGGTGSIGAGAGRLGARIAPKKLGAMATPRERVVMYGRGAGKVPVIQQLSTNPYTRFWQKSGTQVAKRLPTATPLVGGAKRGLRPGRTHMEYRTRALQSAFTQAERAVGKLSLEERHAYAIRFRYGKSWRKHMPWLNKQPNVTPEKIGLTQEQFNAAKPILEKLDAGDQKQVGQYQHLRRVIKEGNLLNQAVKGLDADMARAHVVRAPAEVHGIREVTPNFNNAAVKNASPQTKAVLRDWALVDSDKGDGLASLAVPDLEGGTSTVHIVSNDERIVASFPNIPNAAIRAKLSTTDTVDARLPQVEKVVELLQGERPVYFPDRPTTYAESGKTAKGTSDLTLLKHGLVNWDLNMSLYDLDAGLRSLQTEALYEYLAKNAPKVRWDEPLPKGFSLLMPNRDEIVGRILESAPRELESMNMREVNSLAANILKDITTKNKSQLKFEGKHPEFVTVVPDSLKDKLAAKIAYEKVTGEATVGVLTTVWKQFVLAFSPRFIFTNMIGNAILVAINHPTVLPTLMRSYANHIFRTHGVVTGGEYHTMLTHFGQHSQGLGMIERPNEIKKTNRQRKTFKAMNFGYHAVGAFEEAGREAIMVKVSMQHPKVRRKVQEILDREGRATNPQATTLNKALTEVFNEPDGAAVYTTISQEIDRVLGDYRNLTHTERFVRVNLSPFYTWMRHISRTTSSMAFERPVMFGVAAQMGGAYENDPSLPSFMRQYMALGDSNPDDNLGHFINLQPYNPFGTTADLVAAGEAVVHATPGELPQGAVGVLGPLPQMLVQTVAGESVLTGAPVKGEFKGLGVMGALAETLAQAGPLGVGYRHYMDSQIDRTPDSPDELYTESGRLREPPAEPLFGKSFQEGLMNWAGLTRRTVNLETAEAMAREERGEKKPKKVPVAKRPRVGVLRGLNDG